MIPPNASLSPIPNLDIEQSIYGKCIGNFSVARASLPAIHLMAGAEARPTSQSVKRIAAKAPRLRLWWELHTFAVLVQEPQVGDIVG